MSRAWNDVRRCWEDGDKKVYHVKDELGDCFCIAERDCWRPGAYASAEAAWLAFNFDDEVLQEMQNQMNMEQSDPRNRNITLAMLESQGVT